MVIPAGLRKVATATDGTRSLQNRTKENGLPQPQLSRERQFRVYVSVLCVCGCFLYLVVTPKKGVICSGSGARVIRKHDTKPNKLVLSTSCLIVWISLRTRATYFQTSPFELWVSCCWKPSKRGAHSLRVLFDIILFFLGFICGFKKKDPNKANQQALNAKQGCA